MVRSLKIQEELWKKKQQEEQEEQAREKVLQGALASQEEGLVHFKAQWEAIQPDLKKARQLDVADYSLNKAAIYSRSRFYKRLTGRWRSRNKKCEWLRNNYRCLILL